MPDPLRFGMFLMPVHPPAKPLAQCYDEDLELVCQCEALGFDEFWVGEHHSSAWENIVSPEIFIGKALGMTNRMRIGPAPICLQYHNPIQLAGRLAFLDHLSHGRLELAFGPGAVPTDLELHGIEPSQSSQMVAEAIDAILSIWNGEPPYRFDGKFWHFQLRQHVNLDLGIGRLHKPLQRPHPPIAIPAISRNSNGVKLAGSRDWSPFSHHMIHTGVLADHWETYSAAAREAGRRPDPRRWRISRNLFVAETTAEARRLARSNSMGRCIQYILDLTRFGAGNLNMWKRDAGMHEADCNLDYFLDEVIIAGDPAEVTRQVQTLRGKIGPFGTLVLVAHDWDDRTMWQRSLELFTTHVAPALRRD